MTAPAARRTARAPAKLNLTLRVGPRRPDGFHELDSLVVQIDLCDEIRVSPRSDGRITLTCNAAHIPADARNLAVRAAESLARHAGRPLGVHIELVKRIPAGAGLGGGSSDAAATLRLLNDLYSLRIERKDLAALAAEIGSDVPLFLHAPLCRIRGRGERVTDLPAAVAAHFVLIMPPFSTSTAAVYARFDELNPNPVWPPHGFEDLPALAAGAGPITADQLASWAFNELEPAAAAVEPRLASLRARLQPLSPRPVRMTGSGSTLFIPTATADEAARLAPAISAADDALRLAVCRPIGR